MAAPVEVKVSRTEKTEEDTVELSLEDGTVLIMNKRDFESLQSVPGFVQQVYQAIESGDGPEPDKPAVIKGVGQNDVSAAVMQDTTQQHQEVSPAVLTSASMVAAPAAPEAHQEAAMDFKPELLVTSAQDMVASGEGGAGNDADLVSIQLLTTKDDPENFGTAKEVFFSLEGGEGEWVALEASGSEGDAHQASAAPKQPGGGGGGGAKTYKCSECRAEFTQAHSLKAHIRIHTGERPYGCSVCDATFRQATHLRRHQRVHTGQKDHECGECEARFSTATNLKVHQHSHSGVKLFRCGDCGKAFTSAYNYRYHRRTQPRCGEPQGGGGAGEQVTPAYVCPTCRQIVKSGEELKEHALKHEASQLHPCQWCGARFSQRFRLGIHQRRMHAEKVMEMHGVSREAAEVEARADAPGNAVPLTTQASEDPGAARRGAVTPNYHPHGPPPYVCSECGESFTQPCKLKQHLIKHSSHKPFKCQICDKRFKHRASVKYHMNSHEALERKLGELAAKKAMLGLTEYAFEAPVDHM